MPTCRSNSTITSGRLGPRRFTWNIDHTPASQTRHAHRGGRRLASQAPATPATGFAFHVKHQQHPGRPDAPRPPRRETLRIASARDPRHRLRVSRETSTAPRQGSGTCRSHSTIGSAVLMPRRFTWNIDRTPADAPRPPRRETLRIASARDLRHRLRVSRGTTGDPAPRVASAVTRTPVSRPSDAQGDGGVVHGALPHHRTQRPPHHDSDTIPTPRPVRCAGLGSRGLAAGSLRTPFTHGPPLRHPGAALRHQPARAPSGLPTRRPTRADHAMRLSRSHAHRVSPRNTHIRDHEAFPRHPPAAPSQHADRTPQVGSGLRQATTAAPAGRAFGSLRGVRGPLRQPVANPDARAFAAGRSRSFRAAPRARALPRGPVTGPRRKSPFGGQRLATPTPDPTFRNDSCSCTCLRNRPPMPRSSPSGPRRSPG